MKLTYDDFLEKYTPVLNYLDKNAGYNGTMFETFGEELRKVLNYDKSHVWTIIDGDGSDMWIVPGYHIVNRFGYFITEQEWKDEEQEYCLNDYHTTGEVTNKFKEFLEEELGIELTEEQEEKLLYYLN